MALLPALDTQQLSEEEQQRLANLGKNGPRDVEGHQMTHCVPNEHHGWLPPSDPSPGDRTDPGGCGRPP